MLVLLALLACHKDADTTEPETVCEAPAPPAEATLRLGQDPDTVLLPNGRVLTPAGVQVQLDNQLGDVVLSPDGRFAYVQGINRYRRTLNVVDVAAGAVLQTIERDDAWYGLAMTADGRTLYASGGRSGAVQAYDVADDGTLTAGARFDVGGYPAGLALSEDEAHLYVAQYGAGTIATVDVASGSVVGSVDVGFGPFSLVRVPGRTELWTAELAEHEVAVVEPEDGVVTATFEADSDPEGLVASPDGQTVYAALSSTDEVVAWDVDTMAVVATASLVDDVDGPTGDPLPAVGPNALALDASAGRLYVSRSADNAVGVLDATDLGVLGSFPVGWYPAGLAVAPDGTVVVSNMKGKGAGPNLDNTDPPGTIDGSVSIVDPSAIDLPSTTQTVAENLRRADGVYPFDCDGRFPVPTRWGEKSEDIEHVVLIVRENKTYDVDLGDLPGTEGDPDAAIFADLTPNLHALATQYGLGDNFYTDSEVSTQGHLWLSQIWVDDFIEKSWMEDYHGGGDFADDPIQAGATPGYGSFFTHLIRQKVPFRIYGEITGAFDQADGESVMSHVDLDYPGVFFDLDTQDTDRAAYAADRLVGTDGQGGDFPPFVYMLLPDDHTKGGSDPTPEAMIADNDAGTGLFIDRLSHSKYWDKTVVFVVEDDPQQGTDHIDAHRSFVVIASPWTKAGHDSTVLTSFPSVFKTIELILGIPPMNRFDAFATPLWDSFTSEPHDDAFDAIASPLPWSMPWSRERPAPELAAKMDFSGPDRAPLLGEWLWWYRKGSPRPGSVLERYANGDVHAVDGLEGDDDGDDEVYEDGYARFERWLAEHPDVHVKWKRPVRKVTDEGDDDEDDDR